MMVTLGPARGRGVALRGERVTKAVGQRMLTRAEVANMLAVPPRTLDQWAYTRKGPRFYRVGKHVRYIEADVARWLAGQLKDPER